MTSRFFRWIGTALGLATTACALPDTPGEIPPPGPDAMNVEAFCVNVA